MLTLNINGSRVDISTREELEKQAFTVLTYTDFQEFSDIINNSDKIESAYNDGYKQGENDYQGTIEHYMNICNDLYDCLEIVYNSLNVDRLNKTDRERIVKDIKYQLKEAHANM